MIITPMDAEAIRYEVWARFTRQVRRTFAHTIGGGNLSETCLLFDNMGLDWSLLRGKQAIFVRPVLVEGEPAPVLLWPWLMVPADTYSRIHDDFQPAVQAVGARFRRGEAANLIFLAQLTPVS